MKKILIVEDEKDMVTGLKFNLEARDYAVIVAYDGVTGYQKALSEKPDLVILDIMLPKLNGYEVCKSLKKEIPDLPIIMLTAKSQEAEIVTGLEIGADDYITKPFSVLELLARIKALFRRTKSGSEIPEVHRFGDLELTSKNMKPVKKVNQLNFHPGNMSCSNGLLNVRAKSFPVMNFLIKSGATILFLTPGPLTHTSQNCDTKLKTILKNQS